MHRLRTVYQTRWGHLALPLLIVVPLYVANGQWSTEANHDVIAANVASWQIADKGTLDLSEYEAIRSDLDQFGRWFVQLSDGRVVSNRPPGLIALAIPAYSFVGSDHFSVAPGTMIALVSTLGAIILTWRVLFRLVGLDKAIC